MSADCLFCKIVSGDIPANKIFENEHTVAFYDISPQAPAHVLVIPKVHTASIAETADNALLGEVLGAAREVAAQLPTHNFRVVINNGEGAGQTVFHLHAHLLSGRPFQWPPG